MGNIAQYVCREWVDKLTETGVTVHLNLAKVSQEKGKRQFVEKLGG